MTRQKGFGKQVSFKSLMEGG